MDAERFEAADELQRRATEVDIERRLSSEQRAVRARDEVLAVVSHDLRNPLAVILLEATQLLRASSKSGDERARTLRESRGAHPEIDEADERVD